VKNKKPYISKKFEVFKSLNISKSLLNTLNLDIITTVSITN